VDGLACLLFSDLKSLHVVADDLEFFFQFTDLPVQNTQQHGQLRPVISQLGSIVSNHWEWKCESQFSTYNTDRNSNHHWILGLIPDVMQPIVFLYSVWYANGKRDAHYSQFTCGDCGLTAGTWPYVSNRHGHTVSEGHRWSLRSSSDNMCAVPRTHNSFGDRSFGAVGPRIWNSLPRGLRTLDISYKHFKVLLKTCFDKATALCDILYKRLRNTLTYVNGKWLPDTIERLKASAWHQALSTALTIYPCQIRVHQRWQS